MERRGRYKKVTTVSRDIFGNKRIETRWEPDEGSEGSGCGSLIVLAIIAFFLIKGCG